MEMRRGERAGQAVFRSKDRVFLLGAQWYFQTREYDHGPFDTRQAAEHELERYVYEMQYCNAANMNPAFLFGEPRHKPIMQSELRLLG